MRLCREPCQERDAVAHENGDFVTSGLAPIIRDSDETGGPGATYFFDFKSLTRAVNPS